MSKSRMGRLASIMFVSFVATAFAVEPASQGEDGKYLTAEGAPTYRVQENGTVDWYTFSGFRRYHSECHVCHGPDGAGSSYAPALAETMRTTTYEQFQEVVVNGKQRVNASANQVMPALGDNRNVMCYLDDIYVYLKARADGVVQRGRPEKREDKPRAATDNENSCMGRSS